MEDPNGSDAPDGWRSLLAAELRETAVRRPWGRALMAVGGVHLAFFAVCQALYTAGVRTPWPSPILWSLEVAAVFGALRFVAGRHWYRDAPVVGLVARVWVTFLILSFNVASLNTLTGLALTDWFKLAWCSLASFGFATMAWLFGLRYLVQAFQMYFTSLLVVRFPDWSYLIHGVSWCVALQWIGLDLTRRRACLLGAVEVDRPATRSAAGGLVRGGLTRSPLSLPSRSRP